ncbi:MAG: Gfo/Idh/MocA family oxidoreductase [Thaumarchaeota archaeon]|nr:Gfo/Idh/MocA family oxidoreductase [Candidatus Calditenuaceae archaeon]MDW8187524.1 Gfo/Idh/MocA family oxidoreductase [Nitrososphaerota archaeon]
MDREPVRIAVIGAGFWGRNHVRVLSELQGCEVVAICDVDLARAKEVSRRFKVERYLTDYRDLVNDDVDAVTVCTPSTSHARITIDFLLSGKHVLIEKPMASNLGEALDVVDASKSSKGKVMVGHIERFNPAVARALTELEAGAIGDPLLIYGRRIGPWPERIGDVGVVHDTTIHDIDLAYCVFGSPPESIYAVGGSLIHTKEDHVQVTLTFNSGRSAVLESNWLTPRKKREMYVTGTQGVIRLEFLTREVVIEKSGGSYSPMVEQREPLRVELEEFVKSISEGKELTPNQIDGLISVAVADAVLLSLRTKRVVRFESFLNEHGVQLPT